MTVAWGIEHPDAVDLITVGPEPNLVRLIIAGPDAWDGSKLEQERLSGKIDSYLAYVQVGNFINHIRK